MATLQDRRQALIAERRRRGTYQRWVLITCLVGVFATSFPFTILAVSLGDIAADFGSTDTVLTWVVSAPMLAGAVALPMFGRLGDVLGQRRVFVTGFALASVLAGLTALAWSPLSLIGLRTLSQVVGAATGPTSMALIMREVPREDRVKAMGWWSLVGAGAPALGLAVGGPLVEAIGWRPVFVAQAVLAVIPVAVAWFVLEEVPPSGEAKRFDPFGAVTLALTAGGIMFALTQGRQWGWLHPTVVGAALAVPVAAALFVRTERRVPSPLLPLELLRRRNFVLPLGAEFFSGASYMGAFVLTPLFLRGVIGSSLSSVALLMLLRPASLSLASPVGGMLAVKFGERPTALFGQSVLTLSMVVFATGAFTETVALIAAALVLQGLGTGVSGPPMGSIYLNAVEDDHIGMSTATKGMTQQIGNALGIALLTAVYGGVSTDLAFARAYVVAAGVAALSVVMLSAISRAAIPSRRQPTPATARAFRR